MSKTIFISDLHLSSATPLLNLKFKEKLEEWKGSIDALYILGDLFELWIGDDHTEPIYSKIEDILFSFSKETPLYIMRGNRDFLLGEKFESKTGCILLEDPVCHRIYNEYVILTHGDSMCTLDIKYQKFRLKMQNPKFKKRMIKIPLFFRKKISELIRYFSKKIKNKSDKIDPKYDVSDQGIDEMKKYFNEFDTAVIIHGHTHKPAKHHFLFQKVKCERIVVPDWNDEYMGFIEITDENNIFIRYF